MKQKPSMATNTRMENESLLTIPIRNDTIGGETEIKPLNRIGANAPFELSDGAGIFLINSLSDMESFKDKIKQLIEDIEQDFPEVKNEQELYN